MKSKKNPHASALGSIITKKSIAASRQNGTLHGGRVPKNIPRPLWREVRRATAEDGITMRDLYIHLFEAYLQSRNQNK